MSTATSLKTDINSKRTGDKMMKFKITPNNVTLDLHIELLNNELIIGKWPPAALRNVCA